MRIELPSPNPKPNPNRSNQPAVMRRKIEKLEMLVAELEKRNQRLSNFARDSLVEKVNMQIKLDRIDRALQGVDE